MLNELVNVGACSQANLYCAGSNICELDIKELKTIYIAPYGYKFPNVIQNASQLSLVEMQNEVIALKIVPKIFHYII